MSASSTPTLRPCAARPTARLVVTDDLPTPPLPEAIANTRVSESARTNGFSRAAGAVAELGLQVLALLVRHHART